MYVEFKGSVPKDLSYPDDNEDAFLTDEENELVVLSDGASESFDSKSWSRILIKQFVVSSIVDHSWTNHAIEEYIELYDFRELSWSKQAAYERGSFATFLGIKFLKKPYGAEIIAVGDSLVVLVDEGIGAFIKSFPYSSPEEYNQKPYLLSTKNVLNDFMQSNQFPDTHKAFWKFESYVQPIMICMTDAIGEWVLRKYQEGDNVWLELLAIRSESQLRELVTKLRDSKEMKTDDSTLIVINPNG